MSKPGSPGNPNLFCALSQEQLFRKLGSYASGKRRETLANAVAMLLSQTGWLVPGRSRKDQTYPNIQAPTLIHLLFRV